MNRVMILNVGACKAEAEHLGLNSICLLFTVGQQRKPVESFCVGLLSVTRKSHFHANFHI